MSALNGVIESAQLCWGGTIHQRKIKSLRKRKDSSYTASQHVRGADVYDSRALDVYDKL